MYQQICLEARQGDAMKECIRCGSDFKVERHHIKHRVNGGDDSCENLEFRCRHCHKYQHTKERLLDDMVRLIQGYRQCTYKRIDYYIRKLNLQTHRLTILEQENTPINIRLRGYIPYWNDDTTH